MGAPESASNTPSGTATPDRFTSQNATAEDIVKSQTVGLVQLSDFRKRRAEVLEQSQRDSSVDNGPRFIASNATSGAGTLIGGLSDGGSTPQAQRPKKRKKAISRGALSFATDDAEEESSDNSLGVVRAAAQQSSSGEKQSTPNDEEVEVERKRLGPNSSLSKAPKILTKSALIKEAQAREQLRKEFLVMQEAVKATEIVLPFVFFDGTNIPGGACKIKKGEHVWLFLDRSRKVGAELGVGGDKSGSRREWARVGVDDLMLVRGGIIIPHHYEFYYFIINKTAGPSGKVLFDFESSKDMSKVPPPETEDAYDPLNPTGKAKAKAKTNGPLTAADMDLEGVHDDPGFTKVVDRRWYERNKHIYPASTWEEFEPDKDYSNAVRKDAQGNAFFF